MSFFLSFALFSFIYVRYRYWNYDEIQCWKGRRVCSTDVDCDFLEKKTHDQKVNKRVSALSEEIRMTQKGVSRVKITNKLNPHMTPSAEIEPEPHWWKASALTTRPTLPPI